MKGDFSRFTFDPKKRFSSVRMQQGRVQLDADWNEQADIIEHRIATEITDFIGQSGGPQGEAGFEIGVTAEKLTIGYGRYYVEGMLYENDKPVTFDKQPDYPGVQLPSKDGYYLAYLDVWQRHLTALEDPDIREPALGGADTATRSRNVWQVRLQHLGDQPGDRQAYLPPDWQPDWEQAIGSGKLTAEMSGAWTGLENQLYRVEIHDAGGPGQATYKWSRDNGSIAARVAAISRTTITLSGTGRVMHDAFEPNQWVELTNEERTLKGRPGLMVQLGAVQGDQLAVVEWPESIEPDQLMIAPWPDNAANPQHVIVRRWDSQGAIPIPGDGAKQTIEAGIQIWFSSGKKDYFKTGDYWMFPARNLTGKVEWPGDETGAPLAQPPRGIRHQYCSLALLEYQSGGWRLVDDLRVLFRPVTTGLVNKAGDTIEGDLDVQGTLLVKGGLVMPVGVILPYAGREAPEGWLLCDGGQVDRSSYPDLFNVIGATYGGREDSFQLPDLRGRGPMGLDLKNPAFSTLGRADGEQVHHLEESEMPSHQHGVTIGSSGGHNHSTGTWGGTFARGDQSAEWYEKGSNTDHKTTSNGQHEHAASSTNTGGSEPHNNLQPYLTVNFIIKY